MVALEALEFDEHEELSKDERVVDGDGQFNVSVVSGTLALHHATSDAPTRNNVRIGILRLVAIDQCL